MGALAVVGLIAYALTTNSSTLSKQSKTYRDDRRAEIRTFVDEGIDCYNTVINNNLRTCHNRPITVYGKNGTVMMATGGSTLAGVKTRAICGAPGTLNVQIASKNSKKWSPAFAIKCPQ